MKKVSIIIPVYNCEKYIRKCLDSVIKQDFKDYEVLVINDGSTDTTESIVNEYIQKCNNVRQYINENHGVSFSRNYGIQHSDSEYLVFVDADDILKENYLNTLVSNINNDVDLVCASYEMFNKRNKSTEIRFFHDAFYTKNNMGIFLEEVFYTGLINPVWNKIFRNSIIKENRILFREDLSIGEDLCFVIEYLSSCKKGINVKSDIVYKYNKPDFFAGKKYGDDYKERNLLNDYLLEFYKKNNLKDNYVYDEAVINMYVLLLYDGCTKENIKKIKKEKKYKEVLLNFNKLSIKYKLFFLGIKYNWLIILKFYMKLKNK